MNRERNQARAVRGNLAVLIQRHRQAYTEGQTDMQTDGVV